MSLIPRVEECGEIPRGLSYCRVKLGSVPGYYLCLHLRVGRTAFVKLMLQPRLAIEWDITSRDGHTFTRRYWK